MTDNTANIEDYHVAFIDILGFKTLMNSKESAEIYGIFKEIVKSKQQLMDNMFGAFMIIRIMSDSIVVACQKADYSLLAVCYCSAIIQQDLLKQGIFVRGGIAEGSFLCEGEVMFGKGLIKAYQLENSVAKYPRIIVDTKTITDYISHINQDLKSSLSSILERGTDEIYYLDWISFLANLDDWETHFETMEARVTAFLDDTSLPDDVRTKYLWVRDEINDYADRNPGLKNYSFMVGRRFS